MATPYQDSVLILDFGSQYAQLIARRVRELNVYSEIVSNAISVEEVRRKNPKGIILSGGPASVYAEGAPTMDGKIFELGIPVLGICYGMQLGCQLLGGKVENAKGREYGHAKLKTQGESKLFGGLGRDVDVWMSHGDIVSGVSGDFEPLAHTANSPLAAVRYLKSEFYGIQFHPEVQHTPRGIEILRNFLYAICGCEGDWRMDSFIEVAIERVRRQAGKDRVILGLSGGVDSAVAAALLHKAIGNQLICIFVDNGLLRGAEAREVIEVFKNHFHVDLRFVDATEKFLSALKGVTDPEQKRKIIGRLFIDVFKEEAHAISGVKFLAQGTIYPDVIESASPRGGPSATIKSHHNVGGLPKELGFELVEPFRELFKDEVRQIGLQLGLPRPMIYRHPFPGPGLAVRILGEISPERLRVTREADTIVIEEIRKAGLYEGIWQAFAVLLPVSSVGVMGDERTYENTIALRVVDSTDGMTADWRYLPDAVLRNISSRIVNEVKGVNRVVLDVTSKPPATIEWE